MMNFNSIALYFSNIISPQRLSAPSVVSQTGSCTNPRNTTETTECKVVCSSDNKDECVVYFYAEEEKVIPVVMNPESMSGFLSKVHNVTNYVPTDQQEVKTVFDIPDYVLINEGNSTRRAMPPLEELKKHEEKFSEYRKYVKQLKIDRKIIKNNPIKYFHDRVKKERRSDPEERTTSLNVIGLYFAEIFEYWEKLDKFYEDLNSKDIDRREIIRLPDEPKDYDKKFIAIEWACRVIGVAMIGVGAYQAMGLGLTNSLARNGMKGLERLLKERKNYAETLRKFYEKHKDDPSISKYWYDPRKPEKPGWDVVIETAMGIFGWAVVMVAGAVIAFTAKALAKDDVFYDSEDCTKSGIVIGSKEDVLQRLLEQGYYMDGVGILRDYRGFPVVDKDDVPVSFASDDKRRSMKDFGKQVAENFMLKDVPRKELIKLCEWLEVPELPQSNSSEIYCAIACITLLLGVPTSIVGLGLCGYYGYKNWDKIKSVLPSFWSRQGSIKPEIESEPNSKKSGSETPGSESETPGSESETPVSESETPVSESETPGSESENSDTEIESESSEKMRVLFTRGQK